MSASNLNLHTSAVNTTLTAASAESAAAIVKAVAKAKAPTKPRYDSEDVWNPDLLFSLFDSWESNEKIPLSDLRAKAIALGFMDLMCRSSDLAKCFRSEVSWSLEGDMRVRYLKPKEWKVGGKFTQGLWSSWIHVQCFGENPKLCTPCVWRAYLTRTEAHDEPQDISWEEGNKTHTARGVFVSTNRQGGKIGSLSSDRISNVMVDTMKKAGIDTMRFSAHSARGNAASIAEKAGVPVDAIVRQARWSQKSTYLKWYRRGLARDNVAEPPAGETRPPPPAASLRSRTSARPGASMASSSSAASTLSSASAAGADSAPAVSAPQASSSSSGSGSSLSLVRRSPRFNPAKL